MVSKIGLLIHNIKQNGVKIQDRAREHGAVRNTFSQAHKKFKHKNAVAQNLSYFKLNG